jgi:hypothetical protein
MDILRVRTVTLTLESDDVVRAKVGGDTSSK